MKKGGFFFFFLAAFLYADSLNLVYSVSTNALKSMDFKNSTLLYSTVRNVYIYDFISDKSYKKHMQNIVKARLNATGDTVFVLNKYDGINILDNDLTFASKIPGEFENFFLRNYSLLAVTKKDIQIYDYMTGKKLLVLKKSNIKFADFERDSFGSYLIALTPGNIYIEKFYNLAPEWEKTVALKRHDKIKKFKFLPEGKFLVFKNNEVDIYSIGGDMLQKIIFRYKKIKALTTAEGRIYIATDNKIYVYEDAGNFVNTVTYKIKPGDLRYLAVSGSYIAVGEKYKVRVYDINKNIDEEVHNRDENKSIKNGKSENISFNMEVNPKTGKTPLEVNVKLMYNFESKKIKKLIIAFDDNIYDMNDKNIKEFNYIFKKPGMHKIEVQMDVGNSKLIKKIYVNASKE